LDALRQGDEFVERDQYDEARKYFELGLEISRKIDDRVLIARSLTRLANLCNLLSRFDEALSIGEQGLVVARESGDRVEEAKALTEIGNAHFYLDQPVKALEAFEATLAITRVHGDGEATAGALKDAGITLRYVGEYDRSFKYLYDALDIYDELNLDYPAASVLQMIGMGYYNLGADRLALETLDEALKRASDSGHEILAATFLTSKGYVLMELEEPALALECFRAVLEVPREKRGLVHEAWTLMGVSAALSMLDQKSEAIEYSRRAMKLHQQLGKSVGDDLKNLGYLLLESDPRKALAYFRKSLAAFGESETRQTWVPYAGAAKAYQRLGNLERAAHSYSKAIERLESVRERLASGRHRATFGGKAQSVYLELIEVLLEQHRRDPLAGKDIEAFSLFERTKARALFETISEARWGRDDDDLRHRQDQSTAPVDSFEKRLPEDGSRGQNETGAFRDLFEEQRELNHFAAERKQDHPGATWQRPGPLPLAEIQSSLDQHTTLVAYVLTRENVFAFVVTSGSIVVEQLAAAPALIGERVEGLIDLLSRNSDGWRQISRRLYSDLVAPLRGRFAPGCTQVVIVPDGALHNLPFEALIENDDLNPDNGGSGRLFIEDFIVSYAPSATVLTALGRVQSRIAEQSDLIMFANPVASPVVMDQNSVETRPDWVRALYAEEGLQVGPIPFSAREAREISAHTGPGSAVYTGRDASERRVKTTELERFRVIHFATHSLVSLKAPSRSALVLSAFEGDQQDGFLQAREIYHLRLASDMVVLSACRTARGRLLAGEGVESLSQAFFYAGAKSVVASLWDVNDQQTASLMGSFYRHLAAGESKASALRLAKLELLNRGLHHWPSFILIGESNRGIPMGVVSGRGNGRLRAMGIGLTVLVVVVVAGVFAWRIRRRVRK
jgi:CHAT domain-containing protein/tetratricopeptide (TPR) repeat protein